MNHIDKQAVEIAQLKAEKAEMQAWRTDFLRHLSLPKFREDTTIQVQDVRNWLYDLHRRVDDATSVVFRKCERCGEWKPEYVNGDEANFREAACAECAEGRLF